MALSDWQITGCKAILKRDESVVLEAVAPQFLQGIIRAYEANHRRAAGSRVQAPRKDREPPLDTGDVA